MQTPPPHHRTKIGLIILLGFVLLVEDIALIYSSIQQIPQSVSLLSLYAISISTILTFWVYYDSLSLNTSMGMDQAMYIFFGWPIMFPVYAFRSRGFRSGGLLLLALFGLSIISFIAAIVITFVISVGIAIFSAGP